LSSAGAAITVTGVVQGVGFRYFCYKNARAFDLCGWARNHHDGSVEIYVEGDQGSIESFIAQIKVGPSSASVRGCDIEWKDFTGRQTSFSIT